MSRDVAAGSPPRLWAASGERGRTADHAELFAGTRLAATPGSLYGAVDLGAAEIRTLLERALS